MRQGTTLCAVVAALAVIAAACGGGDNSTTGDTSDEATVVSPPATVADTEEASEQPSPGGDDADSTEVAETGTGELDQSTVVIPETVVRFATADGEELEGVVYGTGDGGGGVVLAHMRGRDRSTWRAFAERAAGQGHKVLAFDFRGYGSSSGERDTNLDIDLTAAVAFLESQGVQAVVVMGASMGGTATVNVASQLDLAGAVSLSAPADFIGLPAVAVAADVTEPLLLIVAERDQPYADAAVEMDALARTTQLQVFEGNAHGTNLFGDYDTQLTDLLLAFLTNRLG